MVYSAKEAEFKELVLRRDLINIYPQLAATMGLDGMRNFNKHVFFPKFLQDPSLIDIMFPDTIDEMKAEQENEQLSKNKYPDVLETDEHLAHIYIHYSVQPKTVATWFHIAEHESLLAKQKAAMMMQEQMAMQEGLTGIQSSPDNKNKPINKERLSSQGATAPLKQEMKTAQPTIQ